MNQRKKAFFWASSNYTICSLLPSFWLGFCWLLDKGGVVDEQVLMFGGVDVVGEFPEQPTPLTECWYIIESPGKFKRKKRKFYLIQDFVLLMEHNIMNEILNENEQNSTFYM